jgi:hypothetical protein
MGFTLTRETATFTVPVSEARLPHGLLRSGLIPLSSAATAISLDEQPVDAQLPLQLSGPAEPPTAEATVEIVEVEPLTDDDQSIAVDQISRRFAHGPAE